MFLSIYKEKSGVGAKMCVMVQCVKKNEGSEGELERLRRLPEARPGLCAPIDGGRRSTREEKAERENVETSEQPGGGII